MFSKMRIFVVMLITLAFAGISSPGLSFTRADVIDGFVKTVFGSEFGALPFSRSYVRKFRGTVRFYIRSEVGAQRRQRVERFVRSLNGLINNFSSVVVQNERQANFVVHVVTRKNYARTVRERVTRNDSSAVRGRCQVRAVFTRSGISRSDAVIVADEGEALFRRCMTEEVLQGLGPLNDDRSLTDSMFNDTSRYTRFRRFDRIILNMLYDPRIKSGMSATQVKPLLPAVYRSVVQHIASRG